jgi:hypothetical protein
MSVIVIGAYVAPAGTVTLSEVAEDIVTAAFTAPKKTILLLGTPLKFVPVIVTTVPTGPEVGEKVVMVGTPNGVALALLLDALSNPVLSAFLFHLTLIVPLVGVDASSAALKVALMFEFSGTFNAFLVGLVDRTLGGMF